ncbi:unnamed protein product [Sphenostylis stenocarpa]|uniref:Uncharacterized protein n=1 Tax=Sphenostylis stenocarpa TaxID=92480 RepID=A0AA86SZ82_9FABA|nr:unnamed protein product [Sphenostylis stenocarpa]
MHRREKGFKEVMEIKLLIYGNHGKLDGCCDGKKLGLKGERRGEDKGIEGVKKRKRKRETVGEKCGSDELLLRRGDASLDFENASACYVVGNFVDLVMLH